MEASKILQAEIIDIVFDNRNKGYGAYNLRKEYSVRLMKAMGAMLALVAIFWVSMSFSEKKKDSFIVCGIPDTTTLVAIKTEVLPESPIDEPVQAATQKVKTKEMLPPVVKSNVDPKSKIETITDRDVIGIETNPDGKDNAIVGVMIDKVERLGDTLIAKLQEPIKAKEEDKIIYINVQQEASFPGGAAAWRKFLMRELNPNRVMENGVAPGAYTVLVEFVVSKNGELSDVGVVNRIGFGLDEEAIRAIKKGPKWIPAKQNDLVVNAYRRQPITFLIPEQ